MGKEGNTAEERILVKQQDIAASFDHCVCSRETCEASSNDNNSRHTDYPGFLKLLTRNYVTNSIDM